MCKASRAAGDIHLSRKIMYLSLKGYTVILLQKNAVIDTGIMLTHLYCVSDSVIILLSIF